MTGTGIAQRARGAVVVGVDGSPESWAAVIAAAWEAQQRHQPLLLVHGYFEPLPYQTYGWSPYVPNVADVLADPKAALIDTSRQIGERYPDLEVHVDLLAGGGSGVLVQLSAQASLVVVGSRGHGGFAGLSIGSVAAQTAAYARCPVLVVRHPDVEADDPAAPAVPAPGPIVIGVNGSVHDQAALRFAFEEASLRGAPLIGVHVWWFPPGVDLRPTPSEQHDQVEAEAEAERVVAEAMAGWSDRHPDVPSEFRTVKSINPSSALVRESIGAGLVVVGCRGRGGFTGLVLGSVSRDLIGHAQAPVAVIHDHA